MVLKCEGNEVRCIFWCPLLALVCYCVPFSTTHWVVASHANWGLWSWCNTTADGRETCSSFSSVYNEGYFVAVRTVSILAFIAYTLSGFAFLAVGMRAAEGKRWAFPTLSLAAGVLTLTAMGILAGNYQTDRTFQHHGPTTLGWSVWIQGVSAAMTIFSTVFYCCIDDKRWQIFAQSGEWLADSCSKVTCECFCNKIVALLETMPPTSSPQNLQPTAPSFSEVSVAGTDDDPPPPYYLFAVEYFSPSEGTVHVPVIYTV